MPDTPRVVALPGTLCAPAIFADVAAHSTVLQDGLVTIPWLSEGTSWELPAVADRVLHRVGRLGDRPVLLAGHSTGGVIALLAALAAPERVAGLLLSNTGANMRGHGDVKTVIDRLDAEWGPEARARVLDRCFHYPPHTSLRQHLDDYASSITKTAVLQALRSQLTTDLAPQLARLTMPVGIAHGRHDPVRPVAHAELLAQHLAAGTLTLLDAGHTPMAENPASYTAALDRLLRRCTQPV